MPLSTNCRAPRAWQDPAVPVNDLVRCISGCILNLEIYITVGRSGQDPHTPGMFCTGCGSQLLGGVRFCTACGQAIPLSPAGWGGMQGEEHQQLQLGAVPGRAHTRAWTNATAKRGTTDARLRMTQQQAALDTVNQIISVRVSESNCTRSKRLRHPGIDQEAGTTESRAISSSGMPAKGAGTSSSAPARSCRCVRRI